MKAFLFKLTCLTNLHVGSGDVNYNIIDNEVEKDITGYPIIHASGVKGAFRDAYAGADKDAIFGSIGKNNIGQSGTYKFFDAKFLARPLRVSGDGNSAYILTTTVAAVNDLIETAQAFGCCPAGATPIAADFGTYDFLVSKGGLSSIEDNTNIGELPPQTETALKALFGNNKIALAKDINQYDLPVVARNCLDENKKNLWYEEYVPHHSLFWLIVLSETDTMALNLDTPVQFGGNASIGYGFTQIREKWGK